MSDPFDVIVVGSGFTGDGFSTHAKWTYALEARSIWRSPCSYQW